MLITCTMSIIKTKVKKIKNIQSHIVLKVSHHGIMNSNIYIYIKLQAIITPKHKHLSDVTDPLISK